MQWQFPAPSLVTDTRFMGRMDKRQEVGSGTYNSQLDRVVYDRADIRKECEKQGYGCNGGVEVKRRQQNLDEPYQVAEHHVAEEVADVVAAKHNGRVSKKKHRELMDKTRTRMSGTQ